MSDPFDPNGVLKAQLLELRGLDNALAQAKKVLGQQELVAGFNKAEIAFAKMNDPAGVLAGIGSSARPWDKLTGPKDIVASFNKPETAFAKLNGSADILASIDKTASAWDKLNGQNDIVARFNKAESVFAKLNDSSGILADIRTTVSPWDKLNGKNDIVEGFSKAENAFAKLNDSAGVLAGIGKAVSPWNKLSGQNDIVAGFSKTENPWNHLKNSAGILFSLADASSILNGSNHQLSAVRSALNPSSALHTLRQEANSFEENISGIRAFDQFARFRLHSIGETPALAKLLSQGGAFGRAFTEPANSLQKAMGSMHSPWLNVHDTSASARGFSELFSLGRALKDLPPFGKELTTAIRSVIGDWRNPIDWPADLAVNPGARLELYNRLGFDRRLTDFPSAAFDEISSIAGLSTTTIADQDAFEASDEEALVRTNKAHDCLQRFERKLRTFIETKMRLAFGEQWIKNQVPGEVLASWKKKLEQARNNGDHHSTLIEYADFTDYIRIIERSDNWEKVFKPVFRRIESVKESFQRLYPIRLCTMHARFVTQDDELYLLVETKRILTSIS